MACIKASSAHPVWRRRPSISKACAINTLAHELTHTIVADPAHDNSRQLYTDDGYRSLTGPVRLVSYTLGSLAQCTYMQKNTLIPPTDAAFDECMRTWGTHSFMVSKECTKHDKTPVAETDCPLP